MNGLSMFAMEISIPLSLGLIVSIYLKGVTARLLVELCGNQDRSEFWIKVTAVLLVAVPTTLVLAFGWPGNYFRSFGDVVRLALSLSLIGIVIVIGGLARTIWKTIPVDAVVSKDTGSAK